MWLLCRLCRAEEYISRGHRVDRAVNETLVKNSPRVDAHSRSWPPDFAHFVLGAILLTSGRWILETFYEAASEKDMDMEY